VTRSLRKKERKKEKHSRTKKSSSLRLTSVKLISFSLQKIMQFCKDKDEKPLIGLTNMYYVCFAKPFPFTFVNHKQ